MILVATEQFNNKPKQGVTFLQERGIISDSSSPSFAEEIASFLVDNPRLNKAMIGEYVGDRKYPAVLDAFVKYVCTCLLLCWVISVVNHSAICSITMTKWNWTEYLLRYSMKVHQIYLPCIMHVKYH